MLAAITMSMAVAMALIRLRRASRRG